MTAIGIDTHKATLAACLVDALGRPLDEREFRNDAAGHRALVAWVLDARRPAPGRRHSSPPSRPGGRAPYRDASRIARQIVACSRASSSAPCVCTSARS